MTFQVTSIYKKTPVHSEQRETVITETSPSNCKRERTRKESLWGKGLVLEIVSVLCLPSPAPQIIHSVKKNL